jgi:glycosyltransferase involved in cell wall biosynthesis
MAIDSAPRIVISTLLHGDGPTGVETHFNAFCNYLQDSGRPALLVTPFDAPSFLVYPTFGIRKIVDLFSGPASVWWYRQWHEFFLRLALRGTLRKHPNSVVYAQCPLSARAALKARMDPSQAVVMVVHFNGSQADEWCEKGKLRCNGVLANSIRRLEAMVLPALDGIVYVSRYMKHRLETRLPLLSRVENEVIPNFSRPAARRADVSPADIINVGTLEPRKNQGFLLQVLAYARSRGHCYTLSLVGDGPDRAKLERLARELGVEDQVRFLGNQPRAIELMGSARVYAHAATIENLPMVLIEAMSCGLPILAPNAGGIPDLIEDGRSGCFWSVDDIRASGDLLIRILNDPSALEALGRAGKARFDERFEMSRVAVRLERFISQRGKQSSLKRPAGATTT